MQYILREGSKQKRQLSSHAARKPKSSKRKRFPAILAMAAGTPRESPADAPDLARDARDAAGMQRDQVKPCLLPSPAPHHLSASTNAHAQQKKTHQKRMASVSNAHAQPASALSPNSAPALPASSSRLSAHPRPLRTPTTDRRLTHTRQHVQVRPRSVQYEPRNPLFSARLGLRPPGFGNGKNSRSPLRENSATRGRGADLKGPGPGQRMQDLSELVPIEFGREQ